MSGTMANLEGFLWLVGYVFMNLFTTTTNKLLMKTFNFPFPDALVLLHYSCTALGSFLLVRVFKTIKPAELSMETHKKLFLFSILFNINILVSAVSLNMVSMALHQIIRALTPAFTVVICFFWQNKRYPLQILLSLGVIFAGVTMYALKGEIDYTLFGLLLTLFGGFLAALKGVITNIFMVGSLQLHPFDLLQYMSGYALLQMGLVLTANGTLSTVFAHLRDEADVQTYVAIALNGATAFLLNIVSFLANKKTSPLAMNIGGITKQVLAIILGIIIFATPMTVYTALGVGTTIVGIVWYTTANFRMKQAARAKQQVEEDVEKHEAMHARNMQPTDQHHQQQQHHFTAPAQKA